jgi:hypothetical protein
VRFLDLTPPAKVASPSLPALLRRWSRFLDPGAGSSRRPRVEVPRARRVGCVRCPLLARRPNRLAFLRLVLGFGSSTSNNDEFINKTLPYYGNLATIFDDSIAAGQFARTSHESLATEVGDNTQKDGVEASSSAAINPNEVGVSSSARASKESQEG